MTSRRDVLHALACAFALGPLLLNPRQARALDRIPYGGTLRLHVPLGLSNVDPHDLFNLEAALLTSALFDPLYALDASRRPYPTVAERLPEVVPEGLRVTLRPGLSSAQGKSLGGSDVLFSLKRALAGGARLLLEPFGEPRLLKDQNSILFPRGEPTALATALASPLTALVPRGFVPARPDGTGPFGFGRGQGGLILPRNVRAARGGGFLDRIEVWKSPDLAAALRAFEADDADVGWLASGLHRARSRATRFDSGPLGWIVLCTGRKLGPWAAPGVAQTVLDSSPLASLSALGLRVPENPPLPPTPWRGPPAELLVDASSPQLTAIARALVEALGGGAAGVEVAAMPQAQLATKKATGDYALLLEFVRRIGTAEGDDARALLQAAVLTAAGDRASSAGSSPKTPGTLSDVTRRLRLGVVGELRLRGAYLEKFARLSQWQLGEVYEASGPTEASSGAAAGSRGGRRR